MITGKTISVQISPVDTIDVIKKQIHAKEGILEDHIKLIFAGLVMQEDVAISQ